MAKARNTSSVQHRLVRDLANQIAEGVLAPGRKLPTTRELAEQYGVAVQTAHHAMRELADNGLVERSPGRGSFVLGRERESTRIVGVIASTRRAPHHSFLPAFVQEMTQRDVDLRVLDGGEQAVTAISALPGVDRLLAAKPAVVVVEWTLVGEMVKRLLPATQVICTNPTPTEDPCHFVAVSGTVGGRLAARALLASGVPHLYYSGVQFARGDHHFLAYEDRERLDAFRWELGSRGRDCAELHLSGAHDVAAAVALLRDLPRPLGIFCSRAHRTVQLAKAAAELRWRIPRDLVLIAGDDSEAIAALDLTALDSRYPDQARACADLVDELLRRPQHDHCQRLIRIVPQVNVRTSCPPPIPPLEVTA
jgi:DNA-binding transcriptional regulator YhcF (GntR family)